MAYRQNVHIHVLPNTWLGRLLAIVAAAALLVLAFFFLTFVLAAVGVMILVALARLLLPTHKTRRQTSDGSIEGEYSVESEEEPRPIDSATHIVPKQ
jgi:membrane protein implicated in regulation of membrane protease activity